MENVLKVKKTTFNGVDKYAPKKEDVVKVTNSKEFKDNIKRMSDDIDNEIFEILTKELKTRKVIT